MSPGAIVVLAVVLVAVAIVAGRSGVGRDGRGDDLDRQRDRSERWARLPDVADLVVTSATVDRAVLGLLDNKLVAMPPLGSVMVVAPTGTGKSSRYVVPTVLRWKGSAVITSVKGDAIALTIAKRLKEGPVYVFDPTGATGLGNCRFPVVNWAKTYPGALKAASWLTDSSQVEKVTSNEQQLWATLGEQLLAPLLFAAANTGRGMAAISDWILFRREDEVSLLLEKLGDRDAEGHWASIRSAEGRTKQSIFITAQRILHVFSHPSVRDALAPEGDGVVFSADDLLTTGGTLYVVSPAEDQELFTPIFETLVNSVVRVVEERSAALGGVPISPRLLLMLEEAANCAPLRRLPTIASAGRGQGIQLVSVWQDEGQIATVYGTTKARTVFANHSAKLVLPGIADTDTLERISDLIGPAEFERESRTINESGASRSTSSTSLPLAPPHFIRELADDQALAVVKNFKPMRLRTVAWYEDPELRALVDPSTAASYDAAFGPAGGAEVASSRRRLGGRTR